MPKSKRNKIMSVTILTDGRVRFTRFNQISDWQYRNITRSSQARLREFGHSANHHITFLFPDIPNKLGLITIWNSPNIDISNLQESA